MKLTIHPPTWRTCTSYPWSPAAAASPWLCLCNSVDSELRDISLVGRGLRENDVCPTKSVHSKYAEKADREFAENARAVSGRSAPKHSRDRKRVGRRPEGSVSGVSDSCGRWPRCPATAIGGFRRSRHRLAGRGTAAAPGSSRGRTRQWHRQGLLPSQLH